MTDMDILVIEDNPADVRLVREALAEGGVPAELHWAPTGEEALDFLRRRGEHAGRRTPDLVLLDLNLPGLHGQEVLSEIKRDPELRHIPVVVLTSSTEPSDLQRAYDAGTNAYIAKPTEFAQFLSAMKHVCEFWININQTAPQSPSAGVRATAFGELN